MSSQNTYNGLEIAIIGMSAQFPESPDHRQFWQNLADGKEFIRLAPAEKLKETGVSEAELQNERFIKFVPVTDDKDCFDNSFFGYSAEEAALMDPQIRLFHEHCWKALEDAGYTSLIEKNKIGLFAGASSNDNWKIYAHSKTEQSAIDPFYLRMITAPNFITTLVSYKLNLRGPSYFVDTACSTSLAALHLACRSLITRDCTIALAGGISFNTIKKKGYYYQEGMILSKDGHCRTFDAQASGTIPGEGAGVVVLKRLSEAIKDRDHIYAIIKATAANNDGSYKVGYTAPAVKGQAECIIAAQKLAGVDPRTITYVEAHGTGTRLGDPVEIRALNEAFGVGGQQKFCAIGSVKTNMGHADAAAGVAGLIKTALSLKHKKIPASLHYTEANPEIDFNSGPFYVNALLKQWDRPNGTPLRAGVSSFGIGGTNVHAVMEEAPPPAQSDAGKPFQLLTLSAKTPDALLRYANNLRNFLVHEPAINLADMAYTLQVGRKAFAYRTSIVYRDRETLLDALEAGKLQPVKSEDRSHSIVFMFPGQGTQYAGMAKDLYEQDAFFREQMDKGFLLMHQLSGEDLKAVLFSEDKERISQTIYTQPIIFLLEYTLANWLMRAGIAPRYMIGHSIGEYVAACLSGVFSFEDAVRLVLMRGRLMNSLPGGCMLSLPVSPSEVQPYVNGHISLAAVNAPEQVVLSGDPVSMQSLMERLNQASISFVKLHTSHAFHSYMQDGITEEFKAALKKVQFHGPQQPFISNLTGDLIKDEEAMSPEYWARHMRETVQFGAGIQKLLSQQKDLVFIEVGVGKALSGLVKQQVGKNKITCLNLVRSIKEPLNDVQYLTERLGELWSMGASVNWTDYYANERRNRISLPAYSFEATRYPADVDPFAEGIVAGMGGSNKELKDWIYYPSWKRSVVLPSDNRAGTRGYLYFSAGNELSESICGSLRKNDTVIEVLISGEYKKISAEKYIIDPTSADHFRQLIEDIDGDRISITDIVYEWGTAAGTGTMSMSAENKNINLVYFSLVMILQALLKKGMLRDKRCAIITDRLHKVTGTEDLAYTQSLLLGLVNVLPQEYGVPCCNIDIDTRDHQSQLHELLTWEIINNTGKDDRIVAYRQSARWLQDFQKNIMPLQSRDGVIKKGGVYLITGGLGNLGFILSKQLSQQYGAKLMLTGRKALNKKSNEAATDVQSLRRLEHLRSINNNVRYFSADVSDAAQLQKVVNEIENEEGPINGVIHAAGVIDPTHFELVEDITTARTLAMFAPKVTGIENLYNIFKDRPLDFVWITSSVATVLGGLGYGSYCSANAYMDHFVTAKSNELPNWKCIGLAEMAFTDQEAVGRMALKPHEIISLFEWSINVKNIPVIIETVEELSKRIRRMYHEKKEAYLGDEPAASATQKEERPELSTDYVAPVTETERKVQEIFETFFCIDKIGVEDGFFELGGDSLKAMILLKRIRKEFNVSLTLNDFLSKTNIRDISSKVDEVLRSDKSTNIENATVDDAIQPAAPADGYRLSSSQLRLWVLCQLEEANIAFNIQGTAIFEGALNYAAMESAFASLIARHEILRTVFKENEEGEVRQYVRSFDETGFQIDHRDLRQAKDEVVQQCVRAIAAKPIDLAAGPLIRVGLYQSHDNRWVFTYVMHHIISDSWSMEILIRELLLLYNNYCKGQADPLTPLRIHYKDYAAWQQERLAGAEMQAHRKYWLEQFKEGVPVMNVSKRKRPPAFSYKGNYLRCVIDKDTTAGILEITQAYGGSLFISLLFFVKLLLFRYTKSNRIMVGTSMAGREHADLENQIGLYINNLPLITGIRENLPLKDFYSNVKNTVVNALQHQSYPLDVLVNEIGHRVDRSRPGLFNVLVELHTQVMNDQSAGFEQLEVKPYDKQFTTTNFDLGFEFRKIGNEIDVLIMYNMDLFSSEEIALMKERFLQMLHIANEFDEHKSVADAAFLIREDKHMGSKTSLKFDMEEKF